MKVSWYGSALVLLLVIGSLAGCARGGSSRPAAVTPEVAATGMATSGAAVDAGTAATGTVETGTQATGTVTITLAPAAGYAGTFVDVSGAGWPASALVLVKLADEQGLSSVLAAIATDAAGKFTTGFIYPIGDRWLQAGPQTVVVHTADGGASTMATFTVVPPTGVTAPTPAPTSAPASAPAAPVGAATTVPATIMPPLPPPVTAVTATSMLTASASASPSARVAVEPTSGPAGGEVTVSGGGFPPNTPLTVALMDTNAASEPEAPEHIYAITTTDGQGSYSVPVTLPATWPDGTSVPQGQLAIIVATGDRAMRASAPFAYLGGAPVAAATQSAQPPAPATAEGSPSAAGLGSGLRVAFLGVDAQEDGSSTWHYAVEALPGAQDPGSWVLELPECATIVTATPQPWEAVKPDPITHLVGIKWGTEGGSSVGEYAVTLSGPLAQGYVFAAAMEPDVVYGTITGPQCQ
jgi:hypothetical protein